MEEEVFFTRDIDWDDISFRDVSGAEIDPNWVDHSGVQFRISATHVEQILKIAKYYATMREETSEFDLTFGAPIMEGDNVLGYADGLPQYRFTTVPCFTNVETITMGGKPAGFDGDWTDVVIWDDGRGLTFICEGSNRDELVFGATKQEFELFLEQIRSHAPTP